MSEDGQLRRLAALIRQRNGIEREISEIIGRPAHPRHMGEFLAARIFNIRLSDSATTKGIDGHFVDGPLAGKSVNVKDTRTTTIYRTSNGMLCRESTSC